MKAVTRRVYGPPDVLELVDIERPAPKKGEVLIRLHATSLNASDLEIMTRVLTWVSALRAQLSRAAPGTRRRPR